MPTASTAGLRLHISSHGDAGMYLIVISDLYTTVDSRHKELVIVTWQYTDQKVEHQ